MGLGRPCCRVVARVACVSGLGYVAVVAGLAWSTWLT